MASSAIRFIACVGVLATSLLVGAACAGVAFADTEDATAAGSETAAAASKSDDGNSDSSANSASNPAPPTSTFGNGRDDVGVQTKDEKKNNEDSPTTKKFRGSLTIPFLRIPRKDELPASGLPNPSLFYTTLVIPVPTLGEFLAAMQPQPPAPAPGPALRTQEVAPPVVDSGGGASVAVGGGGGGVDPLSIGVTAEPPVLQTPLVIAPLPIPLSPPPAPSIPLGAAAGSAPTSVAGDVAAIGAPVPAIRGSLQQSVELQAAPARPVSAPAARLDYARDLRNPTAGELALLALPGVVGLLLTTLSGGFIGYRQANSARMLRAAAAARFLR